MGMPGRIAVSLAAIVLFFGSAVWLAPGLESASEVGWTYHDSFQITEILEDLAASHPDIAEFTTAQDLLGTREITGGRVIPILFLGNRSDDSRQWLMVLGAHHGDEPDSAETVLAFAVHILDSRDRGDPLASGILERNNIMILPVVNPYGLDEGIRTDENGEDPNRDYPLDADPGSLHSDGIPLTTAGASAVHSLAGMYPISLALSFHTGTSGLFTPWGADIGASKSPDWLCFSEMGQVMTRASGVEMVHGPANDYIGVQYLHGAFDDDLYGSSFMRDRVYSDEMILPHSTATCTIELYPSKGRNEELLGSLDTLWEPSNPDDGTLSTGVRMIYSACEMVCPDVEMDGNWEENRLVFTVNCSGFSDPTEIEALITHLNGSTETILPDSCRTHPFMPETDLHFSGSTTSADDVLDISVEYNPHGEWDDYIGGGYPDIAPQSILARSQIGTDRESLVLYRQTTEEPETENILKIVDTGPVEMMAGDESTIRYWIDPVKGDRLVSVSVRAEVGLLFNSHSMIRNDLWDPADPDSIPVSEEFLLNNDIISYTAPMMEGEGTVILGVRTEKMVNERSFPIDISPRVSLRSWQGEVGEPGFQKIRIMADVAGAGGATQILYGLSADQDQAWTGSDWLIGPLVKPVPGNGSYTLEIDQPRILVDYYLFLSTSVLVSGWNSISISSPLYLFASGMDYFVSGDTLFLGPAIVLSSGGRGLEEVTGDLRYIVRLYNEDDESERSCELTWIDLSGLSGENLSMIREYALSAGVEVSTITGAWIGEMKLPEREGRYVLKGRIEYRDHWTYPSSGFAGTDRIPEEAFDIGRIEVESKEQEFIFDYYIVIIFMLLIIVVFVVSIVRYPARNTGDSTETVPKGRGPITGGNKAPIMRSGDYRRKIKGNER